MQEINIVIEMKNAVGGLINRCNTVNDRTAKFEDR